jgi:hypothetical protein
VGGYYQDEYRIWGWVFREFISCYERWAGDAIKFCCFRSALSSHFHPLSV